MMQAAPSLAGSRTSWRVHLLLSLLLAFLALVTFYPTLKGEFAPFDDDVEIQGNAHIHSLSAENLRWMFTDTALTQRYTPLSWVAWALLYQVAGLNPHVYHMHAWLLHAINALLLYNFLLAFLRRIPSLQDPGTAAKFPLFAAAGAAIWAVHPHRAEVLGWTVQVRYAEAFAFAVVAFRLYLKATDGQGESGLALWKSLWFWGSVGAYSASVLFYPSVITLPAILVLADLLILHRQASVPSIRRGAILMLEKLPFAAPAILGAAMTIYGRATSGGIWGSPASLHDFSLFSRVMQAAYAFNHYLLKPLNPLNYNPLAVTEFNPWSPLFVASLLLLPAATLLLFLQRRRYPGLLFLWTAHLAAIVPFGGYFEHPYYLGDRYSYFQAILFAIAIAWGLGLLYQSRRLTRTLMTAVAIFVVALTLILANLANALVRIWHDGVTSMVFLLNEAENDPYRPKLYWLLGKALRDQNRLEEAIDQIDLTLRYDPRHALALTLKTECLLRLAGRAQASGRPDIAAFDYLQAARTTDRLAEVNGSPAVALSAALMYRQAGDFPAAIERLRRLAHQAPPGPDAGLILAETLALAHQRPEAVAELDRTLATFPALAPRREEIMRSWPAEAPATSRP